MSMTEAPTSRATPELVKLVLYDERSADPCLWRVISGSRKCQHLSRDGNVKPHACTHVITTMEFNHLITLPHKDDERYKQSLYHHYEPCLKSL